MMLRSFVRQKLAKGFNVLIIALHSPPGGDYDEGVGEGYYFNAGN
jgi:hypothetical protein